MLFAAEMGMGKNELDHFILIKIGLKTLDVKKRSNLAGFFSPDRADISRFLSGIKAKAGNSSQ